MRDLTTLDKYRDRLKEIKCYGYSSEYQANAGIFNIPTKGVRKGLHVIASSGSMTGSEGWDHVSISLPTRCPDWNEMCMIKDLFFYPDEVCFQLHPAESDNISNHRFCLHIWHNKSKPVPLPPSTMVGDVAFGDQTRNPHVQNLVNKYREDHGL